MVNENKKYITAKGVERLRDPFVLVEKDAYYMYGSEWKCYKNTSGKLDGEWKLLDKPIVVNPPSFAYEIRWAPEVYKYNGGYYMFTTYLSLETGFRGCATFRSESPEGPFVEVSNGIFTPKDKCSIDATLYIDEDGQPWVVYVDEHATAPDKIGRMAIAKMNNELTEMISEPKEIFRADSPSFPLKNVTDGCYLYKTKTGSLLMLWSNYEDISKYCVMVAKSDNGKIDGNWIQPETPLFSRDLSVEDLDGGHGMIFTDHDGQKYLSIHSPNFYRRDKLRWERPIFIKIKEVGENIELDW